jgi:hypothetical protein
MKKSIISIFTILVLFGTIRAQEDAQLENLLEKAEKSTQNYVELFKNLTAREFKTVETFKKDESADDTRKIKSYFIVYQSQKDKHISEFRTVLEFNGKNVSRTDENVVKFFEKLAKSDNAKEEFEKVKKESSRFDGSFVIWGFTLNKGLLLRSDVRKIFDYKITGREKIGDRDVYVVEYRQKEYSSFVLVNPTRGELQTKGGVLFYTALSDDFRPTNPRLNGTFWLDAETGEMWKNQNEISIQPAGVDKPIITNKSLYIYQPSKFNIAVPKTISVNNFRYRLPGFREAGKNCHHRENGYFNF